MWEKKSIYICCRQLHNNTKISQRSHRKVNLLCAKTVILSPTANYLLVKTIQVGTDPAPVLVFACLHSKHALLYLLYN